MRRKFQHIVQISPDMIYKSEQIFLPNGKPIMKNGQFAYKYSVNQEFWQKSIERYHGINIVIDEAHSIMNARRGMTAKAVVVQDWISLLRRVVGATESGTGRLYLITQVERRLDVLSKEQSTETRFCLCHYSKICRFCGWNCQENNETPEPVFVCPYCNHQLTKCNHVIEMWHFMNYQDFILWKYLGKKKMYYKHYLITDIELIFQFYNTMQWESMHAF
jgi:hypothetical protein